MMSDNAEKSVSNCDIKRHYLLSVLLYTIITIILFFSPVYNEIFQHPYLNYLTIFGLYLVFYILIAPILLFLFKPKTVISSRSVIIFNYIKRQVANFLKSPEMLKEITPTNEERQALTIVFIQTFFGAYCVSLLCNNYLSSLSYNFDFLRVMFGQAVQYFSGSGDILLSLVQYINDTSDVWLKIILTIITFVLAISYLSESDLFKNRIKSVDTSFLGIFSCIICYYPITILTDKFIVMTEADMLPVDNSYLLACLNVFAILVNLGMLFAVLRLGTKAGNLTNRGIVTGFPYNIVRHPEYTMQIFYIILTTIPLYIIPSQGIMEKIAITVSVLIWIFIYYLRAITEERHLMNDVDYENYANKVKYKFIPYLF